MELIRKTIEREIGIRIEEVEDPQATIEGGDVLFTGSVNVPVNFSFKCLDFGKKGKL